MGLNSYQCEDHKLDLVCRGCVQARIAIHNKMMDFLFELIKPLKDRDDCFEVLQDEARNLLIEIGELVEG